MCSWCCLLIFCRTGLVLPFCFVWGFKCSSDGCFSFCSVSWGSWVSTEHPAPAQRSLHFLSVWGVCYFEYSQFCFAFNRQAGNISWSSQIAQSNTWRRGEVHKKTGVWVISKQNTILLQMQLLMLEVSNTLSNEYYVLNIVYNFLLVHTPPTVSAWWNLHPGWLCMDDISV